MVDPAESGTNRSVWIWPETATAQNHSPIGGSSSVCTMGRVLPRFVNVTPGASRTADVRGFLPGGSLAACLSIDA